MDQEERMRAVFLDRDGTIIHDPNGYLCDPDEVVLIPGAARAIKALSIAGFKVIVVTNQSGVGRGYFALDDVEAVHARLIEMLNEVGAQIDAFYICPHTPSEGCGCRKPATDMIIKADSEHHLDLTASYIIGDKASDVKLAAQVGAKGILVLTGDGASHKDDSSMKPDFVAADLAEAARWLLNDAGER